MTLWQELSYHKCKQSIRQPEHTRKQTKLQWRIISQQMIPASDSLTEDITAFQDITWHEKTRFHTFTAALIPTKYNTLKKRPLKTSVHPLMAPCNNHWWHELRVYFLFKVFERLLFKCSTTQHIHHHFTWLVDNHKGRHMPDCWAGIMSWYNYG